MEHRVTIDSSGFIRVDGRYQAYISNHNNTSDVYVNVEGRWVMVATFKNFRPYMSARAWAKFVLERRTPKQLARYASRSPIQYAKKLGFRPLAEAEAAELFGKINRRSRTGSTKK